MKIVEWNEGFLLGLPAIDLQHKRIFDCFVTIEEQGLAKHDNWLVDSSFVELVDILQQHFALEESMMRNLSYPGLGRHSEEHRQFHAELHALAHKSIGTNGGVSHKMIKIFQRWLQKHIMVSDRHYVDFFASSAHKNMVKDQETY